MAKNRSPLLYALALIYVLLFLISVPGIVAPILPVRILPEAQLMSPITVFLLPLHLIAVPYFWKKSKALRWLAVSMLAISLLIASKDFRISGFAKEETPDLTVMSYNVAVFGGHGDKFREVVKTIKAANPDVVILQEFRGKKVRGIRNPLYQLSKELGMKHRWFDPPKGHIHGLAILSKYPIRERNYIFSDPRETNSGVLFVLKTPRGRVGIAGIHLHSYQLNQALGSVSGIRPKLQKLREVTSEVLRDQDQQITTVLSKLHDQPFPLILACDLNSMPHSRITTRLTRSFTDSFSAAGNGMGWTYHFFRLFGLRIDYLMAGSGVEVLDHRVVPGRGSDHYPIVATFRIP